MLQTRPLSDRFGVEILNLDVNTIREDTFTEIRAAFEEHSVLLFRGQDMTDETHLRIAGLFGPIEDRTADERKPGQGFEIPQVTNVAEDGSTTGEMDLKTLQLKANFLWHCDSTFMPVPALVNTLTARVVTETGGATQLASTRAAFADMHPARQSELRATHLTHHYAHSRSQISAELAARPMFHKWPAQTWRAVWKNPANGREAAYVASHAYAVNGREGREAERWIQALIAECTQQNYVYSHDWTVGDVLIWDQRAILHRGTPWPYYQPRTLKSICSSVTETDGLT
ncbi:MAG: TauD/TfdA family dioxygenase, partial [Pseudomonadota bacterium]